MAKLSQNDLRRTSASVGAGLLLAAVILFVGVTSMCASPAKDATRPAHHGSNETIPLPDADPIALVKAVVIHPMPRYPYGAYLFGLSGEGVFQIDFAKDGKASKVEMLQSTGARILDDECRRVFRLWRARRPGGWDTVIVPIKFRYGSKSVRWGI